MATENPEISIPDCSSSSKTLCGKSWSSISNPVRSSSNSDLAITGRDSFMGKCFVSLKKIYFLVVMYTLRQKILFAKIGS